jgi:hypothetical protein
MSHDAYIRRETLISMAINGVFSLTFFLIVFGQAATVPLWGVGNWVFDMLPQSFMITLMSTLVPGAFTAKRLRAGVLQPSSQQSRLPRSLALRAVLLSVAAALLGTAVVAALAWASGLAALDWLPALILKVLYGIFLAAAVTPIGLRGALAR